MREHTQTIPMISNTQNRQKWRTWFCK